MITNVTAYDGSVTDCFIAEDKTMTETTYQVHTETTEKEIWNNASKAIRVFSTSEEASAFLDGVGWTLDQAVLRSTGGLNR